MKITQAELLDALRESSRVCDAPEDAMTTREIAAALGIGPSAAKARLQRLRGDGRLKMWTKLVRDASGRPQLVPAYTILPAKRKGK